jgi:diguanylate cyclase (GGDEF)-like protein/PAS domain S-box-containing protein
VRSAAPSVKAHNVFHSKGGVALTHCGHPTYRGLAAGCGVCLVDVHLYGLYGDEAHIEYGQRSLTEFNPRHIKANMRSVPDSLPALAKITDREVTAEVFERMLAEAVEKSPDLIGMTGRDGRLRYVNQALREALQFSQQELVGQPFSVILSKNNSAQLLQQIDADTFKPGGWKGECLVPRKDGTDLPVLLSSNSIRDDEGKVLGAIGIAQDITERKRTEAERLLSAERLSLATAVARVGVWDLELASNLFTWDTTTFEIYGFPPGVQIPYEQWSRTVHVEDLPTVEATLRKAIAERGQGSAEFRITLPDGAIRNVLAVGRAVLGEQASVSRVLGTVQDITERKHSEQALHAALEQLKEQNQNAAKLAELVDILQSCQNADEAYKVIADFLQSMLPFTAGALYITSPSRDVVEMVASWGNVLGSEKAFLPNDCWALRRGKIHRVKDSKLSQRCEHVGKSSSNEYVCVPMAAQGETLGLLYVEKVSVPASSGPGSDQGETLERRASAVGERIALALANLRLREILRSQSIRDPLTGLFNRRFMEESLERELRRALRGKQQVALLMLDIDHFKVFNDTFGHQAGDALLRALGILLRETTRGQDVVCRYGGEEFAFVLAGASLDAARKRAELLRTEVKHLNVRHGGQLLGVVTLSIGIAVFPGHGDSSEHLLKAADDALYRAKEQGRDRIISAEEFVPQQ